MSIGEKPKAPWHLWAVGLGSLALNGFGAFDYLQTQMGNRDYIATMVEPLGIDIDVAIAYFAGFPFWAEAGWAIGVWVATLGSLLLLARSRFAFHAFTLSLGGLIATIIYQYANPLPGVEDSIFSKAMTALTVALVLGLIYYARAMTRRAVLR